VDAVRPAMMPHRANLCSVIIMMVKMGLLLGRVTMGVVFPLWF